MAYIKTQLTFPQFEDVNGNPATGYTINAYIWDIATPTPMYTSSAGAGSATSFALNALGIPVSAGGTPVDLFFDDSVVYKLILKDSGGIQVGPTIGPVYPNPSTVASVTATGGTTARTLADHVGDRAKPENYTGIDKTGATDSTLYLQLLVNSGKYCEFKAGTIKFSTVYVDTPGQVISGAGMTQTVFNLISAGKGFVIRARNVTCQDFSFIPPGYATGTQSSTVADCFTIQESSSDENYIEGFKLLRVGCYNYKGCAVRMISPLRESHIKECRFHGMSNKSTGDGVIHMDNPSTSDRCPNNIWIEDNSVYRFGAPFINFKLSGTSATGRDQPSYADIFVKGNLIHGQWLDENSTPGGLSVVPEPCHHIYIQGGDNIRIDSSNKFAAIHPDYWGVYVDQFTAYRVNEAVHVSNNYMSYGITSPATASPVGGYVKVVDCLSFNCEDNDVAAGYFTYDFTHFDSGLGSSTLITNYSGNRSLNQFPITYNSPPDTTTFTPTLWKLESAAPSIVVKDTNSAAYTKWSADGAGTLFLDADPTAAHSATHMTLRVDGTTELDLTPGQAAINRINFIAAVSDGSTGNSSFYNSSTQGTLAWKTSAGVVRAIVSLNASGFLDTSVITLNSSIASGSVPNNSIFRDSADNVIKKKDNTGVVTAI